MRFPEWLLNLTLCALTVGQSAAAGVQIADDDQSVKPRTTKPLDVIIDTAACPDLDEWAEESGELVRKWHPQIAELLKSDGFTPPARVRLIFKEMEGIAGTSGDTITISAKWVRDHPGDFGMVIHELAHVIQAYPKYEHVWLVEGIADYVRYSHFEPKRKLDPIDAEKASYRDGYSTTSRFLAWAQKKYDKQLVSKLNQALRQTKYEDLLFEDATGHALDDLWKEFVESLKPAP